MIDEKNFNLAMEIFQMLLTGEEISLKAGKNTKLYEAYTENASVNEMVELMLKKMNLRIYNYNYSLFVTAGDHNRVFGYTNEELKRMLGLRLNRELYLCYYLMFQIMTLFYRDSATYTYTEYVKVEDVIEQVNKSLKSTMEKVNLLAKNELEESSFKTIALTWDELVLTSSEESSGARAGRGSKTGYVKLVFNFLGAQNLFVEAQERFYPTDRFHAIIKNYFEEENTRLYELQQLISRKEEA